MRRGSVTVELALVIPVVFLMLVGFVEWGWLLSREAVVVQIARDTAHHASRNTGVADPEGVAMQSALVALQEQGFEPPAGGVTVTRSSTAFGEAVTARVVLPYETLVGVVPTPGQLAAQTTMLLEDQP